MIAPSAQRHDCALESLLSRSRRIRADYSARRRRMRALAGQIDRLSLCLALRRFPMRLVLHAIIAAVIPLAVLLTQKLPVSPLSDPEGEPPQLLPEGMRLDIGPIMLRPERQALLDAPVPDSAFAEILALPEAQVARSRQELLAPLTLHTTVVGDRVSVRGGPGLAYDIVGRLAAGSALTLEAVAGDWFAARTADGRRVWIAAELVADASIALGLLAPARDIPPPPPPKIATVTQGGLTLLDGPGTSYVNLGSLKHGATVNLLARFEHWLEVRLDTGTTGWVAAEHLQIGPGVIDRVEVLASPPDPRPALVARPQSAVNLRGGPGTAYPKVGTAGAESLLELVGRHEAWLKVRTPAGKLAWVSSEVLPVRAYIARRVPVTRDIPPPPQPSAPAAARASQPALAPPLSAAQAGSVVAFALQFPGTRYAWGGASPAGFDCSGFTSYVYRQFGLNLPHSAVAQYSQRYGTFIDRSHLQPGDLVFFANTYKRGLSHVGIYVGDGMVIQALAPGVSLSVISMGGAYWGPKYYGALRPNL